MLLLYLEEKKKSDEQISWNFISMASISDEIPFKLHNSMANIAWASNNEQQISDSVFNCNAY